MNKLMKSASVLAVALGLIVGVGDQSASAASPVMWGKTELKDGQIGKVTVMADTKLVKLEKDGSLSTVRAMKKGEEYRVYSYKGQNGGMYGVGAGSFVLKDSKIKYETPSKSKLALLKKNKADFELNKQYAYEYMDKFMETQGEYIPIIDKYYSLAESYDDGDISWGEYESTIQNEILPSLEELIKNVKQINPNSADSQMVNSAYVQVLEIERDYITAFFKHDLSYWYKDNNRQKLEKEFEKRDSLTDLFQKSLSSFTEKYGIEFE